MITHLRPPFFTGGVRPLLASRPVNENLCARTMRAENRCEAPGRAKGYGCWQLYPLDGPCLPERKTAYAKRKRHAQQNGVVFYGEAAES